jgi:hypothetical protein
MTIYIDVMVRQFTDDVLDLLTLPLCGDVRGVVEAGSLLLVRLRTDDNAIGSTTILRYVHVPPNGMILLESMLNYCVYYHLIIHHATSLRK